MLIPRCRAENGIQSASYADLCESPEGGRLAGVIFPDCLDEAHHSLLGQVLTVAANEEKRTGTGAHQPVVAGDQDLLRPPAALGSQLAELLVTARLQKLERLFFNLEHMLLDPSIP